MDARSVGLGLALLASACAGSSRGGTTAVEGEAAPPAVAPPERGHVELGTCEGAELDACIVACHDSSCLDWCAGSSCRLILAGLDSCVAEVDERLGQAPDYEFVDDPNDPEGEMPSEESVERVEQWTLAYEEALDEHWTTVCGPQCRAQIREDDEGANFCAEDWSYYRSRWAALTELPEPPSPDSGMLGAMNAGLLGSSLGAGALFGVMGTSLELVEAPSVAEDDERLAPLRALVSSQTSGLYGTDECVPEVGEEGARFEFELELGAAGEVAEATLVAGDTARGACVGSQLSDSFALPVRVARDIGRLRVVTVVRPAPDYGLLGGMGDDLGAYGGMGGIGSQGSGLGGGGGGSAAGIGGLGTAGTGAQDEREDSN